MADPFKRPGCVFALNLKLKGDCLLHSFEQLVNRHALGMTTRKGGNTPYETAVFILLDNHGVFSAPFRSLPPASKL